MAFDEENVNSYKNLNFVTLQKVPSSFIQEFKLLFRRRKQNIQKDTIQFVALFNENWRNLKKNKQTRLILKKKYSSEGTLTSL